MTKLTADDVRRLPPAEQESVRAWAQDEGLADAVAVRTLGHPRLLFVTAPVRNPDGGFVIRWNWNGTTPRLACTRFLRRVGTPLPA